MINDGELYKRYDAKKGKTPPEGFIPAQEPDPVTGHWPGWLKVGDGKEDKYHIEGYKNSCVVVQEPGKDKVLYLKDGTYELVGPKINGNKDKYSTHFLMPHGECIVNEVPRTFDELKKWFGLVYIEGIVWHHPDSRMVKIKKKDFGYKW